MNRKEIMVMLSGLNISHHVIEHPPAHSIGELDGLGLPDAEQIAKNLFLRDDKRKNYYLVTVQNDKTVNLKALRSLLDTRPLSFASEDELSHYLGLKKGEVTPLGMLNDTEQKVNLIMDEDFLESRQIGVHPNENTATLWLSPGDLINVIQSHGNAVRIVRL